MSENEELQKFEVEVECLWAGTTTVEAEDALAAVELVENLPDSEIIHNDMSPGDVRTGGVYDLD